LSWCDGSFFPSSLESAEGLMRRSSTGVYC
jgi:hypothetical protein